MRIVHRKIKINRDDVLTMCRKVQSFFFLLDSIQNCAIETYIKTFYFCLYIVRTARKDTYMPILFFPDAIIHCRSFLFNYYFFLVFGKKNLSFIKIKTKQNLLCS